MNMLEFVTVKDDILKFLQTHHPEAIDSDVLHGNSYFNSQPNGVMEACISEMEEDNSITVKNKEKKTIIGITDSGMKLLDDGGYVKLLFEKRKSKEKLYAEARKLRPANREYKRQRQASLISDTVGVLSLVGSLLFKRIL